MATLSTFLEKLPIACTSDSEEPCARRSSSEGVVATCSSNAPVTGAAAAATPPTAMIADELQIISEECFDVPFSDVPPRERRYLALSLADYRSQEVADIIRAKTFIKALFANRTVKSLKNVGIALEDSGRLADLVMNGGEVCINADCAIFEYIYEHYHSWKTIENYQCLLISPSKPGDDKERQLRREEMMTFCLQAFPHEYFDETRMNETDTYREVSNRTEVTTYIRHFFQTDNGIRAKRALHAMILFFGHGSPQGFCAGHQKMPLDDIISMVQKEWINRQLQYPEDLPVKVEIIFVQCYGHVHSHDGQNDRFKVTAFTFPDKLYTVTTRDLDGKVQNQELTPYAEGPLREEVVSMEVWRRSDDK